ncbi:MAG: hypothetical protein DMD91_15290 [Candidatus Rokuibacteriota bacterium]|nr:MAG: hypothetical protein DMD91_15290 [Candidatus Rokubacteria bacterium]
MRQYHYVVEPDGRILHDGTEIVDPATLRLFLRAMQRTSDGRWLVVCQGEHNWFEATDTPFVIQRLRFQTEQTRVRAVELCLAGELHEPLDPASLESEAGLLFCKIRGGVFRARFGRVAMQQLSPFLTDDGGAPALIVDGRPYPIAERASDR